MAPSRSETTPGIVERGRAGALLRATTFVLALVASVGLSTGPVRAADPPAVDETAASAAGHAAGPIPAIPPRPDGVTDSPQVVFHGPRTDRVVALTFDDGYSPANVRRIFTALQKAGVTATFFVNGAYLHADPQLWRSIAAAGYPIGNHTVLHRDVRGRPRAQVVADLVRNARLVQEVTGRPMIPVFRPPYGYHDAASDAAAAAAGFPTIVLWDVSGGDADRGASEASVLAKAGAGRPGSIVLLHAGPSVTPRILPALIARYRARGFRFVTVPELLGIATPGNELSAATGSSAQPEPRPVPPPPAVPPAGDDLGTRPVSRDEEPAPSSGVVEPSTGPRVTAPTGGLSAGQGAATTPDSPSGGWDPAPRPEPAARFGGGTTATPRARDSAWARRPSSDGLVAGLTVGLLVILLLLGAILGRRARRAG